MAGSRELRKREREKVRESEQKMAGSRRSLSDFDDNIIEKILSRLPTKDAAQTSVLARRWRCSWLSVPVLDLSDLSRYQIDEVLRIRSLDPIRVFRTEQFIPVPDSTDISDIWRSTDVERWLKTLSFNSANSLRSIFLHLSYFGCDVDCISCCFPYLTHLELSCPLSVPLELQGFATLRELHLLEVFCPPPSYHYEYGDCDLIESDPFEDPYGRDDEFDFDYDDDGLSRLISACPLLETLEVNAPNRVRGPIFSLDINAPNLRRLKVFDSVLSHFSLASAPLLETVTLNSFDLREDLDLGEEEEEEEEVTSCNLMKVLGGLTTIKKLEADYPTLKFLAEGHVPERIPLCFNNLRTVSLQFNFGDTRVMSVVLCLLRSCPNLKELVVDGEHSGVTCKGNNDIWGLEVQEDTLLLNNLEILRMKLAKCTRHELGFIKFVLAKAQILKIVKINFYEVIKEKYWLAVNLLEFPRSSNQARIILTDDE